MQADRQTDGRPQARVHANTRMHALMNAGLYDQTFGHTNMHVDRQTDGWTDGRRHTHTCSYGGKHPSTNMEVRSKKLEVRR